MPAWKRWGAKSLSRNPRRGFLNLWYSGTMGRARWLEVLVLVSVVAVGAVLFAPEPGPSNDNKLERAVPTVNGISLGMTLEQAQRVLGPDFRTIELEDMRFELRGPGEYPTSVSLRVFPTHDQSRIKRVFDPKRSPIINITGTRLGDQGAEISVGDSVEKWNIRHPKHQVKGPFTLWHFPNMTAWAEVNEDGVAGSLGLHYGEWPAEHNRPSPELPPDSTLPVREPGLLTAPSVALDGVSLGMSEAEVLRITGQSSLTWADPNSGRSSLSFSRGSGHRVSVRFRNHFVWKMSGEGQLSLNGMVVCDTQDTSESLLESFGRVDTIHRRGFSGEALVFCWSETDIVLEARTYGEKSMIGEFVIVDPLRTESPHYPQI